MNKTSDYLEVGHTYSRAELRETFAISDATLNTGVFRPSGHNSIWLFVTQYKTADRTQYSDQLDGEDLFWDGQSKGRTDPLIINHSSQNLELILFYRRRKYEYPGAAFRYEGVFEYVSHTGSNPAHFHLRRTSTIDSIVASDLDALMEEELFEEGGQKGRFTNYYERDRKLRTATIQIHGTICMVCGFDFERNYGMHGVGYIEVHHLVPVSSLKSKVNINPKTDMAVVCANCHRMIHRKKHKILSINELRSIYVKSQ